MANPSFAARPASSEDAAGLPARRLAATVIEEVLRARTALDETHERLAPGFRLEAADASLARAIAVTAFRRLGTIRRHPDVAWTKLPEDRDKLSALQSRLLDAAAVDGEEKKVQDHN